VKETRIEIKRSAQKELTKLPYYIRDLVEIWINHVLEFGLNKVRMTKSYHDEPLQGVRFGQRSVRLNKSYRIIYIVKSNKEIELLEIIEINKHKY
jgi:proteic killer suppression protein